MTSAAEKDSYNEEEAQKRFEAALNGAFKTPATPKTVTPKKAKGKPAKASPSKSSSRASSASAKSGQP